MKEPPIAVQSKAMPGDATVEQVKERTDIVALIGEHVRLKRAGTYVKGLCPFHHEDTPSFVVSPSRQMFHCFGCGESGDVFTWLMKREGMTFPEALRVLAGRVGVQLSFDRPEKRERRDHLRATLTTAADFYHAILTKTASGKQARVYLQERGITEESIEMWRLGYVPKERTPLLEKAQERGVHLQDLKDAGILGESARGPYERFYGRLLFPLSDTHGSVVGFAGRILAEDRERPAAKYVNSPETTLYRKSQLLYGLDKARDAIREKGVVVIVEGYTDVILSHQIDVRHVVATSGTALTEDHLLLLKRFTDTIAFAFDADAAGDAATRRALELALIHGFTVSIVLLPSGDDPADLARKDPDAWRQATITRTDVFSFLLERALAKHPALDPHAKKAITQDVLPLIARVSDAVIQGDYLQKLASALFVDPRFLREDLDRVKRSPVSSFPSFPLSPLPRTEEDPRVKKEERFLMLLLVAPGVLPLAADYATPDVFFASHTRHLYEAFVRWYDVRRATGAFVDLASIYDTLPEDLQRVVDVFRLALEVEKEEGTLEAPEHDARLLLRDLLVVHIRRRLQEMTVQLGGAAPDKRPELLQHATRLTEELARAEHLIP